jgi:hypothetical protein
MVLVLALRPWRDVDALCAMVGRHGGDDLEADV